jgi:ATP-dependent DNA helicase RecG
MIPAQAELASLGWLPAREATAFAQAGLKTVADLLEWLPKRHEDRRRFDAFPAQAGGPPVCLRAHVADAMPRRLGGGKSFFEAILTEDSGLFGTGKLTCRWFNMPFLSKVLAAGQDLIVFGKVKESGGRLIIDHPEFEILPDDERESVHLERIVPIYRNVSGISQRRLREVIHAVLAETEPRSLDYPYEREGSPSRAETFRSAHFPASMEEAETARRRFALEEFFALQLNVLWRRARHAAQEGRIQGRRTTLLKRFHASLPFELTGAQKRSIKEIIADMRSPRSMHRLLQGDVGAGKTFVAMAAMLLAVDSGCQAALMAPTQILAEQHFLTFRRWLEPLGVRLALRTSARQEDSHEAHEGEPQILIGTHALLYDKVAFHDLGFVVIDEQHKFGVAQRELLRAQGSLPDVLVMTATPIPRTLTLTVYGDLDVSLLDEKPPGRGKVITAVRVNAKQTDVTKFVKGQLEEGRQAYLVYPLVEESDSLKAESAVTAFAKWSKRLPGHEVGLLHGKLPAEEKEAIMERFRAGDIRVLVATTVIEVGVDVPNATVMILHHAERFGLAQLHQLRGRIGRGGHRGWCVLLTDGKNPDAMEKLRVLENTSDGFEIAEADLRLRGPGDVLGTAQSGLESLRFADFLADTALLKEARSRAEDVLKRDPGLTGTHRALRRLIDGADE